MRSATLLLLSSALLAVSGQTYFRVIPQPVIQNQRNVQVSPPVLRTPPAISPVVRTPPAISPVVRTPPAISPVLRTPPAISPVLRTAPAFRLRPSQSDLFLRLKTEFYSATASAGNDVVSQTKAQAEGLIEILRIFAADPKAVEFVTEATANSACMKSFDDAISATQAASDLMVNSGPELNTLLNTFAILKEEKDTVALMKGSASMMITLDTLILKWADFPLSTQCRIRPTAALDGMEELAELMYKMGNNAEYPLAVRSYLERSGAIMEAYTKFSANFRKIFLKFPHHCSTDSDVNTEAIGAIAEMMDEINILLNALGRKFDLAEIKQNNINYATQLVDTMKQLRDLEIGFIPCNTVLSWRKTGEELLEIADLVEEIGINELSEQLGIDFNLQFA